MRLVTFTPRPHGPQHLGLVRDGPAGLQLTPEGHQCACQLAAPAEPERLARSGEVRSTPRDARGRRKRGRRTLPI